MTAAIIDTRRCMMLAVVLMIHDRCAGSVRTDRRRWSPSRLPSCRSMAMFKWFSTEAVAALRAFALVKDILRRLSEMIWSVS